MTSAIVFVLSKFLEADATRCFDYCKAHGYEVAGLIRDDWSAALAVLRTDMATVVVVAAADRLDDSCMPRMEIATEPAAAPPRPVHRRRTARIIHKGAEA